MKLFPVTSVKPKPVITAIGAVRALPPSLASTNNSGVPQHASPFRRQPAYEFVPPVCSSHNDDEGGGFWNWENPSDRHDHSRNIRHWQGEDWQHDLRGTIGYLTVTSAEDSALIRDVCKRASATEASAKEATRALRRELKYGDAPQQLSATRLWAIMLGNSSELFVHQCAEGKFTDALEDILHSQRTSPIVRERLLEVIAAAAYASSEVWRENGSTFRTLWKKVKPVGMPDVGVPFGPAKAISKDPLSWRGIITSCTPGDLPLHPQSLQAAAPKHTDSKSNIMHMRGEFDDEDRALPAQRDGIIESGQDRFECAICMDEMPANSIARIDSCGHAFCCECLRGHVAARLDERRFPVLCPTCTCPATKGKGKGKVGEISQSLAQTLGLSDKQYNIWIEMEMAPYSVLLHCRRCKRSMFVARDDHEKAKTIVCPLPKCNHTWCKQCQRSIDGPGHSCDGTAELEILMKQNGWKYCPTCKTPIQKNGGCNHMKCVAPACNTHFCYLCGNLIVKSAVAHEICEATSRHFGKDCRRLAVSG